MGGVKSLAERRARKRRACQVMGASLIFGMAASVSAEEITASVSHDTGLVLTSPESELRRPAAPLMSAETAARTARETYGGRVLAVHWTGENYRVKLLRRGEVRIVEIEGE